MNLYTSEQDTKSYSGALVQEFVCDGVSFWITKGMSERRMKDAKRSWKREDHNV